MASGRAGRRRGRARCSRSMTGARRRRRRREAGCLDDAAGSGTAVHAHVLKASGSLFEDVERFGDIDRCCSELASRGSDEGIMDEGIMDEGIMWVSPSTPYRVLAGEGPVLPARPNPPAAGRPELAIAAPPQITAPPDPGTGSGAPAVAVHRHGRPADADRGCPSSRPRHRRSRIHHQPKTDRPGRPPHEPRSTPPEQAKQPAAAPAEESGREPQRRGSTAVRQRAEQ